MGKYTHFKFDFECAAYEGIEYDHPVKYVDALGVKYEHRTPHSLGNFWLFWNATNIPEPIPKCCSIIDSDPVEWVGHGLSIEDAEKLINSVNKQQLQVFEIWSEGFVIQGNSATASRVGVSAGTDFNDAVKRFVDKAPKENSFEFIDGIWTDWGCRLFDNEIEARKSFG